jgi:adenine-specific DNA-methyltransferase
MKNIFEQLAELLKKDERLVSQDGVLLKNQVQELARKNDPALITLLLSDKAIKQHFFFEVEKTLIFDKEKFIRFVSNKQFLPDSYTAFKNKIGLTAGDEYLSENKEVVLAWPYKDCVLEGGMTKEDQKRDEIFYNETLAPDDINRLLDAKVFTNFKRIDKTGEHKLDGFNRDEKGTIKDNLIIKGNNLLAIASLKKEFAGKLKLIYLDPPYNTPGEANTFSYNNTFNHSSWLTFMKNRIEIAKELASEDGFICLAIDDVEHAYLKVLCDDILGRDNFLASVIVQIKKEGRTDSEFFATSHDYALFYCKNKSRAKINTLSISEENARKWKELDDTGRFYWRDFMRTGGNSTPVDRPNQDYVIYFSKNKKEIVGVGGYSENEPAEAYKSSIIYLINEDGEFQETSKKEFIQNHKDLVEFSPFGSRNERQVWRWSDREKVLWAIKMGEISLIGNKIKIKDRIREGSKPTTTWYDSDFNATSHGTLLLKKMFSGKKVFSYPKSLFTMMDIVNVATNKNTNDIILDIFGGSATTAHAVNRVNKLDKGDRKFIIVEQMDYIEKATLPRIIKSFENNTDSLVYLELAKWNEEWIEKIEKAKTGKELAKFWEEMKETAFLSYKVEPKTIDANAKDFADLSIADQRKFLIECLDKNQLYVNLSEIEDKEYGISKEDIKLNKEFYGSK